MQIQELPEEHERLLSVDNVNQLIFWSEKKRLSFKLLSILTEKAGSVVL